MAMMWCLLVVVSQQGYSSRRRRKPSTCEPYNCCLRDHRRRRIGHPGRCGRLAETTLQGMAPGRQAGPIVQTTKRRVNGKLRQAHLRLLEGSSSFLLASRLPLWQAYIFCLAYIMQFLLVTYSNVACLSTITAGSTADR